MQITPPNCLTIDEWDPKDIDYEHGGTCHTLVHGWDDEDEAKDAWVSGLLPIQCPYNGSVHWDNYPQELEHMCGKAAKILIRPFTFEPHGGRK